MGRQKQDNLVLTEKVNAFSPPVQKIIREEIIPSRVWFSMTGVCNNRCTWCLRKGSEVETFLKLDVIQKATETLCECGTRFCTLTGGEPTLHPDFETIILNLTAEKAFSSCILITNARMFSQEIPTSLIGNKKLHVTVSLHGADPQHYRENTSVDGFTQSIQGARNLVDVGIRCSLSVVLGSENFGRVNDFIVISKKLGVETLCFTIAIPSIDNSAYTAIPYTIANAIPNITSQCDRIRQKHCFVLSIPWCMLEKNLLEDMLKSGKIMFNCPVPHGNSIVIKENGAIALCTHTTGYEIATPTTAENILLNPVNFRKFWGSRAIQTLRQEIDVLRHQRCVDCEYRWWCRGGCPFWWRFFDFSNIILQKGDD